MVIKSILDTDLYKFSMSYAYMKMYPDAEGTFVFCDRNKQQRSLADLERIKRAIQDLSLLSLSDDEFNWCVSHITYIPEFYWEWLKGFRFDTTKINIWLDDNSILHMEVTDKLYRLTLWEIACLAIVSEISSQLYVVNTGDVLTRLDEKIELSNKHHLVFSDFGTRRRFSYEIQDMVVKRLKETANYFVGTSNVHLAMKYNTKPIGTVAHEWVMFHGAMYGYRNANYKAYDAWVDVYNGSLGTALTDTYTSKVFFDNFSMQHAKLFDGIRHDSGDEREFVQMAIRRYKELGIDPRTKFIVFSNALTFPKFKELHDYCEGKINCSAGIGTNLTNDTGFPAQNIVMKLMECRMNKNKEFVNCVKISDDIGKVMGDESEVKRCFEELKIEAKN